MQKEFCSFAFMQFCDQIQSSMHQIFTQIHLTVSIGPSYMKSPSELLQAPPQTVFPHVLLYNFFILFFPQFFFIRILLPFFWQPKEI